MLFVLLAEHNAEVCPTGNATTRDLMLQMAPEMPGIADKARVNIVGGPWVNREHLIVTAVEAENAESVDEFVVGSRLQQWNTVRVVPSYTIEEVMKELQEGTSLF